MLHCYYLVLVSFVSFLFLLPSHVSSPQFHSTCAPLTLFLGCPLLLFLFIYVSLNFLLYLNYDNVMLFGFISLSVLLGYFTPFPTIEVLISNQALLFLALFVQCLAQCASLLGYLLGSMPVKVTIS